ncbi:MAG: methionyl-tRNA formyltransferase [Clostridiales bacterium]|nr:methionyl-tRNA formyltransferase [Clostridiales bacterium]
MKIVFMGTPEFAVEALISIVESGHDVCAVITQTDKPKGRGNKVQYQPVKEEALKRGLVVMQPEKVRDPSFIEQLKKINPECIVVAAYGQILPKEILSIPKYGCVNIHASLLPKYRGAAPIHWAVINGEEKTGITIMQMDAGLDTGDMLLKEEVFINDRTAGELHDVLAQIGARLITEALEKMVNGTLVPHPQNDEEASYAPMLNKKTGAIDWKKTPLEIQQLVRGLNPWPMAYTIYEDTHMKVLEGEATDRNTDISEGTIIDVATSGIEVSAGGKIFIITKIQFPGKKAVDVAAFLRGNEIKKGVKLGMEE